MLAYQRFTPTIRIVCSGTALPAWRWLEHYARQIDTVEIDNSFIGRPRRGSIRQFTLLSSQFSVRIQVRFGVLASAFEFGRASNAEPGDSGPDVRTRTELDHELSSVNGRAL